MSAASFDAPGAERDLGSAPYRDEDFPGCESFHLPASELDRYEGRLEFWDGVTETAWKVCEPTSIQHEAPCQELAQMAGRFAMLRGSRIACFGSADLVRRDEAGRKRWLMQADQVLYLHPDRVRREGPAIDVDADPLPEVVLEVDHTTGRAPSQARDLQGERVCGDLGAGAVGGVGTRAGACHPCAPGGRIPGGRREPGLFGVEGGGNTPRADRVTDVGAGVAGAGADGAGDGCARGHDAAARSAHGFREREGAGEEPRPGRGDDAPGKGHRSVLADPGRLEAPRRAPDRSTDGGGAGVCGRGRFPAAHPRAAQPHGDSALRRNAEDGFSAHPPHRVVAVATQRRGAASGVHRGGRLPAARSIVTVRH